MKRERHSPEQVIRKLRDADRMLSEGKDIALVCQSLEVSAPTPTRGFHRAPKDNRDVSLSRLASRVG